MRIANIDKSKLRRLVLNSVSAEAANARIFDLLVADGFGQSVSGDVPSFAAATAYTAPAVAPGDNVVLVRVIGTIANINFSIDGGVGQILPSSLTSNASTVSILCTPNTAGRLRLVITNTTVGETCAVKVSCGNDAIAFAAVWA